MNLQDQDAYDYVDRLAEFQRQRQLPPDPQRLLKPWIWCGFIIVTLIVIGLLVVATT